MSEWNQYTPSAHPISGFAGSASQRLTLQSVGQEYKLDYRMEPLENIAKVNMKLVAVDEDNMKLVWQAGPPFMPSMLLRAEKVQQISVVHPKDGQSTFPQTRFVIYETQAGPVAHVVKRTFGSKLQAMNQGIADNLKEHFETKRDLH